MTDALEGPRQGWAILVRLLEVLGTAWGLAVCILAGVAIAALAVKWRKE